MILLLLVLATILSVFHSISIVYFGDFYLSDLLPGCLLSTDRVQKSGISEITAQQLALCNSFCINRVRETADVSIPVDSQI